MSPAVRGIGGAPRPTVTVCYPINDLGAGGAERQLVELVKGLDTDQFNAVVVTLHPGGSLEAELAGQPGVVIRSIARRSKYDLGKIVSLARILRRHRVQVVQPFLSPATLFGLSASFLSRTPIRIVTERCGVRINRRLGNRLNRLVEDRLSRHADSVVPNSEVGVDYLVSRGISRSKIRVIPNGINPQRLRADPESARRIRKQLGSSANGPIVGNIASLTSYKGQATLLQAIALVKRRVPDVKVVIVGEGHLRGELETLAGELGLTSSVTFFGHQSRVAEFLSTFDIGVLSSVDNEGCSNFLLEAMGMGKPVVATDVGGNKELVAPSETGILVPPGNHEAMARAILELLENPEARNAMGRRGRQVVATRFSLTSMVNAYQDLYRELAQQKLDSYAFSSRSAA